MLFLLIMIEIVLNDLDDSDFTSRSWPSEMLTILLCRNADR